MKRAMTYNLEKYPEIPISSVAYLLRNIFEPHFIRTVLQINNRSNEPTCPRDA